MDKYEFIVNTSKEFMTLINSDHVYEAANESYCRAHNKRHNEVVGRTIADVWGNETYLTTIKPSLDQCFAKNEVRFQGWLVFAGLGQRYVDVTYYPYYNQDGLITHSVVVSRDMTERKKAQEALQKAHARNEHLLQTIPSILIGVGSNDQITHWNIPAEIAFGIKATEIIGHQLLDCVIDWDWAEILTRIDNCRKQIRSSQVNDVKYTRPNGSEGFLNLTVTSFQEGTSKAAGYLLIGEDVTERKALQAQLAQSQKLESIGQLAAGVAHEINTPTQYLGDNIRFLKDSFDDIDGLLAAYGSLLLSAKAGQIDSTTISDLENKLADADLSFLLSEVPSAISQSLQGIEHVTRIVGAMKEFSHPGVEEKVAIDINKAIESTITITSNEWKYVADVNTSFDLELPPVLCLPGEITQVVLNIIINAAHAIADCCKDNEGYKGIIAVQTGRDGDWVEIRISDTGGGIPESAQSKIFDPFFTTKEVGQGTGQGLAISHAVIVEKHAGTIQFETELGQGTTFIIRLPIHA